MNDRFCSICACVLTSSALSKFELEELLERTGLEVRPGLDGGLLVQTAGGEIQVDVHAERWPDLMDEHDIASPLFARWHDAEFGLYTYPGALTRATEQGFAWKEAGEAAAKHRAFITLRRMHESQSLPSVTAANASERKTQIFERRAAMTQQIDSDYAELEERMDCLTAMAEIATYLFEHEAALAWFVPGGEKISSPALLHRSLIRAENGGAAPLEQFVQTRQVQVSLRQKVVDCVGATQLGLLDCQCIIEDAAEDADPLENFFLNTVMYCFSRGGVVFKEADTVPNGPFNRRWKVTYAEKSALLPPRRMLEFGLVV